MAYAAPILHVEDTWLQTTRRHTGLSLKLFVSLRLLWDWGGGQFFASEFRCALLQYSLGLAMDILKAASKQAIWKKLAVSSQESMSLFLSSCPTAPLPLTLILVRASAALCMSFIDMLLIQLPHARHCLHLGCRGSSERPGDSHGGTTTSYGYSYVWSPFVPPSCSVTYSVSSVSGPWPHCCHQLNSIGHQHPRNTWD